MDRLTTIRAAFAAVGIGLWGFGYNRDITAVRLTGMACMVVALLLRFARRRRTDAAEQGSDDANASG